MLLIDSINGECSGEQSPMTARCCVKFDNMSTKTQRLHCSLDYTHPVRYRSLGYFKNGTPRTPPKDDTAPISPIKPIHLNMKYPILSTQNLLRIRLARSHTSTRRRCGSRLLVVPGQVAVATQFSWFDEMRRSEQAPRRMQRLPITIYAMPRNGFFPPMTVRVEMSISLVPLYPRTSNSEKNDQQEEFW